MGRTASLRQVLHVCAFQSGRKHNRNRCPRASKISQLVPRPATSLPSVLSALYSTIIHRHSPPLPFKPSLSFGLFACIVVCLTFLLPILPQVTMADAPPASPQPDPVVTNTMPAPAPPVAAPEPTPAPAAPATAPAVAPAPPPPAPVVLPDPTPAPAATAVPAA